MKYFIWFLLICCSIIMYFAFFNQEEKVEFSSFEWELLLESKPELFQALDNNEQIKFATSLDKLVRLYMPKSKSNTKSISDYRNAIAKITPLIEGKDYLQIIAYVAMFESDFELWCWQTLDRQVYIPLDIYSCRKLDNPECEKKAAASLDYQANLVNRNSSIREQVINRFERQMQAWKDFTFYYNACVAEQ